jgi:hypothetical protein
MGWWVYSVTALVGLVSAVAIGIIYRILVRNFYQQPALANDSYRPLAPELMFQCFAMLTVAASLLAISIINFSVAFLAACAFVPLYLSVMARPSQPNFDPYAHEPSKSVGGTVVHGMQYTLRLILSICWRLVLFALILATSPTIAPILFYRFAPLTADGKLDVHRVVDGVWSLGQDVVENWVKTLVVVERLAGVKDWTPTAHLLEFAYTNIVSCLSLFLYTLYLFLARMGQFMVVNVTVLVKVAMERPMELVTVSNECWVFVEQMVGAWVQDAWFLGRWVWPVTCFFWWPVSIMALALLISRRS